MLNKLRIGMSGHYLFIVIILFFTANLKAQINITGKILNEKNEPIPGANIYVEGTYQGGTSDKDGIFSFKTTEKGLQTLVASFVGFEEFKKSLIVENEDIYLVIILKEAINKIDGVTITAGSFEASDEKRQTILKPLDIVTTAGVTADLAGALNTLPGTQTVGEEGKLFVRGGEGRETRTFIDGMHVLEFYETSAPNTSTRSRFLPFMFGGTSFSTGGYSAEYGQALSSILALKTKEMPSQNRADISVMTVGGDVSYTHTWDKSSIGGKLQYANVDPYFNLINQEIDWIDPPTDYNASLMGRKKIRKHGLLKIFSNYTHSNFELNRPDIDDQSINSNIDITNSFNYLNSSYKDLIGKDWILNTGFSYTFNEDNIEVDSNTVVETKKGFHSKFTLDKEITKRIIIKTGGEFFWRKYNQKVLGFGFGEVINAGFDEKIMASFLESDIYFSNKFLGRVGGRLEFNTLRDAIRISPRLSLAYRISEISQVSFAFGRFHQTSDNDFIKIAPELKSEKATHYILNYQLVEKGKTFRVEGYIKNYDDLVKFDPGNQFTPSGYSNTGSGFARGFDLFWRDHQTFENVDYWLSYSFLDSERDYRDFPASSVPYYVSRHNLSFVYKHFISSIKSQIGFTYTFASGRPYNDLNKPGFNTARTKSFQDLSFNLSYLLKQNIIIYGSINNILGRDNVFGYEFGNTLNDDGLYNKREIGPPALRFIFLGVFITLTKDNNFNQLPYL